MRPESVALFRTITYKTRMSGVRRWVAGGVVVVGVGAFLWLREGPESRTADPRRGAASAARAPHAPVAAALGQGAPANAANAAALAAVDSANVAASAGVDAGAVSTATSGIVYEIRAVLEHDPALAEQLAREDQKRNPDSPAADERDALLVAAVYNQRDPWRARVEARIYFGRHPNGKWVDFLQRGTGASLPKSDSP